jgi:hypothetical protein
MGLGLGPTRVVAPDGAEWRVGRRWFESERPFRPPREVATDALSSVGISDLPSVDSAEGLLILAGVAILLLLLIPILFFGVELLVVGGLLAAGLAGRVAFGQPWVIQASLVGPPGSERRLEWRVRGWRNSRRAIEAVAADLSAGREPDPLAEPGRLRP